MLYLLKKRGTKRWKTCTYIQKMARSPASFDVISRNLSNFVSKHFMLYLLKKGGTKWWKTCTYIQKMARSPASFDVISRNQLRVKMCVRDGRRPTENGRCRFRAWPYLETNIKPQISRRTNLIGISSAMVVLICSSQEKAVDW